MNILQAMNSLSKPKRRRNNQYQIVDFLTDDNCKTERQIQEQVWGYFRNHTHESNKKYADILRRALRSGKIKRVRIQIKSNGETRKYFRYYIGNPFGF
jgi:hypothetical protein